MKVMKAMKRYQLNVLFVYQLLVPDGISKDLETVRIKNQASFILFYSDVEYGLFGINLQFVYPSFNCFILMVFDICQVGYVWVMLAKEGWEHLVRLSDFL